jgi:hypothetical protein
MMDSNIRCIRCFRDVPQNEKAVNVFLFAQTTGMRPRRKSRAGKISFCPECSVSLAMGPAPKGAINEAAWWVIRNLVSADPGVAEVAWEKLAKTAGLLVEINTELARPRLQSVS